VTAVATAPTLPEVSDTARMAAADEVIKQFVADVSDVPVITRYQSVAGATVTSDALSLPKVDEAGLARRTAVAKPLVADVIAHLNGIDDVIERVVEAQAYCDVIDQHADRIRYDRDVLGLLVMLGPWYDAQRAYRRDKMALDDDIENGRINRAQYDERLEEIERTRRTESAKAKWRPTPAARLAGVSRGLLASRVAPRKNALGPNGGDLAEAERIAAHTGSLVKHLDNLRIEVEKVRNKAIDTILAGPPQGLGWSNAALARLLGVTTARVAQLRTGSR
jgi:uncharacterized protein YkvS